MPPEALLARPGAPLETAQSAMLMSKIIPALDKRAQMVRSNIDELNIISAQLLEDKAQLVDTKKSLQKEHRRISGMINKREKLYSTIHKDVRKRQKRIAYISQQSKNLEELVHKLKKERAAQEKREKKHKVSLTRPSLKNIIPRSGTGQLPVSGIIRTRYNEKDEFGADSKGITIESRSRALVVAPMGGGVRFTGPFKHYGNLVIIEHENGYHSLIAGLEKIDTVVGQNVSAGEPLGSLAQTDGSKPKLYYELRKNGRAINPARKFGELG